MVIKEGLDQRLVFSTVEQQTSEAVPGFPYIQIPILFQSDRDKYLEYVSALGQWTLDRYGRISQKHKAQMLLQNQGIGDPNTILVAGSSFDDQRYVAESYLQSGITPVWIGTCIGNDMSDQHTNANRREHAAFWRGIKTSKDWETLHPQIEQYSLDHPELILKIFPQGKKYSIGRLLTTDTGILIQVKPNQLNGRDDQTNKKVLTLEYTKKPYSQEMLIEGSDDPNLEAIVKALTLPRSIRFFRQLQVAARELSPHLSLLNPEFMLDKDRGIAFFTDLVWGTNPDNQTEELPNIANFLKVTTKTRITRSSKHQISIPLKSTVEEDEREKIKGTINLDDLDKRPESTQAFRNFYYHQE